MNTIEKLIILTKEYKINWDKYDKNTYATKINGVFIKVSTYDINDNGNYQISVKAPYLQLQMNEEGTNIKHLYDTITEINNITSFSVLDDILNKMMENN